MRYQAIADPAGNNSGVAAAATEPGVGASAGTYWAVDADVSWVTGTAYAAPTTDIELHGDGILMFGDADDKSTAGASGTITVRTSDAVEVPGSLSATEGSLFLSKNGRAYLHPTSSNSDWRPLMTNWDYDSGEGTSGDIDLVVGDEKTIFNIGDASADRSINVPTNAAQAFAVGTEIKFFAYWQAADGPYDVAFVAASGVTIRGDLVHDVSSDQSGWTFLLTKVGTDTWILERYKTSHTTSSGD